MYIANVNFCILLIFFGNYTKFPPIACICSFVIYCCLHFQSFMIIILSYWHAAWRVERVIERLPTAHFAKHARQRFYFPYVQTKCICMHCTQYHIRERDLNRKLHAYCVNTKCRDFANLNICICVAKSLHFCMQCDFVHFYSKA